MNTARTAIGLVAMKSKQQDGQEVDDDEPIYLLLALLLGVETSM